MLIGLEQIAAGAMKPPCKPGRLLGISGIVEGFEMLRFYGWTASAELRTSDVLHS